MTEKKDEQKQQLVEELDANFDNDDKEDNQTGSGDKKITSVGLKDAIKKAGEK